MTKIALTISQVDITGVVTSDAVLTSDASQVTTLKQLETCDPDSTATVPARPQRRLVADVVVVTLTLLTLSLHLTGMFIPGWWLLPPDHHLPRAGSVSNTNNDDNNNNSPDSEAKGTTTYGLWTTIKCHHNGTCTEIPIDTSKSNAWLQVTQVFESGAVAFGVLALLCYVLTSIQDRRETYFLLRRLSVFLMSATALSIAVGMAVFIKKSAGLARYPQRTTAGGHLDWPIFFSMAAALMAIVVAVIVGVRLRRDHVTSFPLK